MQAVLLLTQAPAVVLVGQVEEAEGASSVPCSAHAEARPATLLLLLLSLLLLAPVLVQALVLGLGLGLGLGHRLVQGLPVATTRPQAGHTQAVESARVY